MFSLFFTVSGIIGSVTLFLFSVLRFSQYVKDSMGDKVRGILQSITSTPWRGVVAGTLVTSVFQSSSATSVIVVSLVGAQALSFYNSLGLIFGANIGTTITSQLIAFNAMAISPYILLVGFLLGRWGGILKKYSRLVIYFGMIFFSIFLVSYFISQIESNFLAFAFSKISNVYIALLAGVITSVLVQSSSVVSGVIIVMAGTGLLSLEQSLGIILGANIGTTFTAILASLPLSRAAKKVAMAHFLFNLLGVLMILPILSNFYVFISYLGGSIESQIANANLLFNIFSAIVFLIFIKPFHSLIENIFKLGERRLVVHQ